MNRKLHNFLLHNGSSLLLLFLLLLGGCKKEEVVFMGPHQADVGVRQKFFSTPADLSDNLKNIIEKIKSQDESHQFVPDMVKRIGYPNWQASVESDKAKSQVATRSLDSSVTIIPFNHNNLVSAFLVCVQANDSFYFRIESRSALFAHNFIATADSARNRKQIAKLSTIAYFEKKCFNRDSLLINNAYVKRVKNASLNFLGFAPSGLTGRFGLITVEICGLVYVPNPWNYIPGEGGYHEEWQCTSYSYYGYIEETEDAGGGSGTSGTNDDWWNGYSSGSGGGSGGASGFSPLVNSLASQLGLTYDQSVWLENNPERTAELNTFLYQSVYSDLTFDDKAALAKVHLNTMIADTDYLNMVESYSASVSTVHPWMVELCKELAIEIGLKVVKKYLPGYGDWQSIKDAIDNAGHGDWLGVLGEVLNIVKKKVPWLATANAIADIFYFKELSNSAWKAFDKIKDLPTSAINSFIKTIKNKCGGILDKVQHHNNINGKIKYDPSNSFSFFKEIADDLGIAVTTFSTPHGYGGVFDLPGGFTIKYYPVSSTINPSTGIGYPTVEI